jgi:V/A-type H+-transporting ATPase subunit I
MIRPQKMKQVELTVLDRDVDTVIEYLGRWGFMEFSGGGTSVAEKPQDDSAPAVNASEAANAAELIRKSLDSLQSTATYLGIELPGEPEEDTALPGKEDHQRAGEIAATILKLCAVEKEQLDEKKKLTETQSEASAFSKLNAPYAELDHLSYLALRVGRLDPRRSEELRASLGERAVIVPLDDTGRVLAAASRKGRFALDSELKKTGFTPITIPEGYKGIPADLLESLGNRIVAMEKELEETALKKESYINEYGALLKKLTASCLMARTVEELKRRLKATQNAFVIHGWVPAGEVTALVRELGRRTEHRAAIRSYNPEEVEQSRQKIPVSLKHGAFVRGFEPLVLSYGAPLYGTMDPTVFVAFFFTLLFGIMFGDVGHGFVLLLLGFILGSKSRNKFIASFRHFSIPLKAVGITSICMGLLNGSVFTNEHLLEAPTHDVSAFFMRIFSIAGEPPEHILQIMPESNSFSKLFYFMGFTVAVGIILNSIGLFTNIINQCALKHYEKAFFSKTGLAGLCFFWYVLFLAVRIFMGGSFENYDFVGFLVPLFLIFFGPAIWRFFARERPVLEHGFLVFVIEGFVEILESVSGYISNTVSFLRVGAFALSHALLSFIVFSLSDIVKDNAFGPLFSLIILIIGNGIIILLEGMIVAIQVVRLQYYEFFSKFFTETGRAFTPFRFRKKTG